MDFHKKTSAIPWPQTIHQWHPLLLPTIILPPLTLPCLYLSVSYQPFTFVCWGTQLFQCMIMMCVLWWGQVHHMMIACHGQKHKSMIGSIFESSVEVWQDKALNTRFMGVMPYQVRSCRTSHQPIESQNDSCSQPGESQYWRSRKPCNVYHRPRKRESFLGGLKFWG